VWELFEDSSYVAIIAELALSMPDTKLMEALLTAEFIILLKPYY
jgi:hypothetical protein